MRELVDAVTEMVPGAKIELRPGVNPRGNPPDNYLDLSRIKEDLGFTPRYPIDRGVADYIGWLQTHPL
jgi:UDP-glucose 4-epimerase